MHALLLRLIFLLHLIVLITVQSVIDLIISNQQLMHHPSSLSCKKRWWSARRHGRGLSPKSAGFGGVEYENWAIF